VQQKYSLHLEVKYISSLKISLLKTVNTAQEITSALRQRQVRQVVNDERNAIGLKLFQTGLTKIFRKVVVGITKILNFSDLYFIFEDCISALNRSQFDANTSASTL